MDFLILSLQRSGSAWLSNFLTYDICFCYHEPLASGPLPPPRVSTITGAIDTGAYLTNYTAKRMFALKRKYEDIESSTKKLTPIPFKDDYAAFEARTDDLITFHYEYLFDVDYLQMIWNAIVSTPFNRYRAELLIEMNIQRDFDKLVRRVGRTYGGLA